MKKIIIFSSQLSNVNYFLSDTLKVLSKKYKLIVISKIDIKLKKNTNIDYFNLNISRKPNFFSDFFHIFIIFKYLISLRPNLVLTITPKISFIVSIVVFFYRLKRLHFFTGQIWYNKNAYKRFFYKQIDKFILKTSKICFVDSKSQINFLIKEGFAKHKLELINNGSICGVNTNIFNKNNLQKKRFKKKYKIKKNEIIFMFLGRINKEKGFFDLINLQYLLIKNNVKAHFVLIGLDEDNLISKLNKDIKNNFIYLGHQSKPNNFLPCADIFVLLSQREGFGVSVIEASSCCLPIIGYNVVGLKDSILDNITGILINNLNKKKDLNRILNISKNKRLRETFGNQGRKYVKKYFEKLDVIKDLCQKIEKYIT